MLPTSKLDFHQRFFSRDRYHARTSTRFKPRGIQGSLSSSLKLLCMTVSHQASWKLVAALSWSTFWSWCFRFCIGCPWKTLLWTFPQLYPGGRQSSGTREKAPYSPCLGAFLIEVHCKQYGYLSLKQLGAFLTMLQIYFLTWCSKILFLKLPLWRCYLERTFFSEAVASAFSFWTLSPLSNKFHLSSS